jgi:DNA-binding NarL/FixJ family response regulator
MPSAIAVPVREQIVHLKEQGKTYSQIGEALGLSRHSVRGHKIQSQQRALPTRLKFPFH